MKGRIPDGIPDELELFSMTPLTDS
jgi:hypothetical protein